MVLNNYQTQLTEEYLKTIPAAVKADLLDYIENIKFIQNLTSINRPHLIDTPKDETGKVIVDLVNPHRLTDMDYFRQPAIYFERHNCYTKIPPNKNPQSEYAKFWREEKRRWAEGLTRPDGEWIPGPYYFYLNYSPIWRVDMNEEDVKKGKKIAKRIKNFGDVYLGDYLFFHYLHQAHNGGKYNNFQGGSHAKLLKTRGCGFSFKMGAISPCTMYVEEGLPCFHIASDKSFLLGEKGVYGKVVDTLDWIAENTPFSKLRIIDTPLEKQLGYKDEYGIKQGLKSTVFGISIKDDPDKARGARGPLIHYEEDGVMPNLENAWNVNRAAVEAGGIVFGLMIAGGCVCAGTKVWNNNGDLINIENLKQEEGILGFDGEKVSKENISYWQESKDKPCYKITTNTFRTLECSEDHPILWSKLALNYTPRMKDSDGKYLEKRVITKKVIFKQTKDIKIGEQIAIIDEVNIFGNKKMWEPRVVGWLIGDGSYGKDKTPVLSNCEIEINNYIENNLNTVIEKQYITKSDNTKLYKETRIKDICPKLRELGIYGQTKLKKTLPLNIHSYLKEDLQNFIGGLYDTDGHISKEGKISLSSMSLTLLQEVQLLLQKFGIHSNINRHKKNINNPKDKNDYFVLEISRKNSVLNFVKNITLFPKEKQKRLNTFNNLYLNRKDSHSLKIKGINFERVTNIEYIGIKPVYNLTANNTNTYIANGIVTHNTGGTQGADFEGSEKLFYNPDGYNIYGIPNVFDRNADGSSKCGFFWGAYLNRERCYDKNGEPDVIKALVEIITDRKKIADKAKDPIAYTQRKAEFPITPQDAVMKVDGTLFPVADIKDYIAIILPSFDKFVSGHWVGDLISDSQSGEVKWKLNSEIYPNRDYPIKDNKKEGAIEIFEMPIKDSTGKTPSNLYIAGCLTPGEKVITDRGLKNVEEVSYLDLLLNENGEYVHIDKLLNYNVINEDTYNLKISNTLRTTNFTKEHPILVSKNKDGFISYPKCKRLGIPQRYKKFDFIYTKVEDVKIGDWIKVPNIYKKPNTFDISTLWNDNVYRVDRQIENPINNLDFWWFVGVWLGDGWCESDGYKISVSFNAKETYYIEKINDVVTNLFKREITFCENEENTCLTLTFCFQQLSTFLTYHFGKYAIGKRIPEWVKHIQNGLKRELIKGYLNSDGCITQDKKGYFSTEFVSINLELLESIQDMLFALGYISSITKLRNACFSNNFKNKISNIKETYHLRISHNDSIFFATTIYDINDPKISKIDLNNLKIITKHPKIGCIIDNSLDYIYFKVENIKKDIYTGVVYNFECNTHTFMCHHITTHNCDPVDDDESQTSSMFSIFILNLLTDRIVAEYTGRSFDATEAYEKARKMLLFYNARCMYENDKKGLYSYFLLKNCLHLLADNPESMKDLDITATTYSTGNKSKGVNSSKKLNAFGRRLQVSWMMHDAYNVNADASPLLNLHKIRSLGYLREAAAWNPDGNFDRISALGMLMILRAERERFQLNLETPKDDFTQNAFWDRAFKKKHDKIGYEMAQINSKNELTNLNTW